MDNFRLGSFPDVQAFAETDPYILESLPAINDTLKCETILPIKCEMQGRELTGALKLLNQLSPTKFEALIYHESDKEPILEGSVLKKKVFQQKRGSGDGRIGVSAKIGTVIRVL